MTFQRLSLQNKIKEKSYGFYSSFLSQILLLKDPNYFTTFVLNTPKTKEYKRAYKRIKEEARCGIKFSTFFSAYVSHLSTIRFRLNSIAVFVVLVKPPQSQNLSAEITLIRILKIVDTNQMKKLKKMRQIVCSRVLTKNKKNLLSLILFFFFYII